VRVVVGSRSFATQFLGSGTGAYSNGTVERLMNISFKRMKKDDLSLPSNIFYRYS
jgi:hypothetical protein